MDDVTQLSRPRPRLAPRYRLLAEEFLKEYEGVNAEWLPDGMVEILPEESVVSTQLRLDLAELIGVYLQVTNWGHLLTTFKQRTGPEAAIRQADILIVSRANLERIGPSCLTGPADVAIEVVSPDSVGRDYGAKFLEYESGGVREYWLIDPDRKIADVYELGDGRLYQRRPPDAQGRLTSGVLPSFAFDPEIFWADVPLTNAQNLRLVADMLGVPIETLLM